MLQDRRLQQLSWRAAMYCRRFGRLGGVSESRSAVMREEKRVGDEQQEGSMTGRALSPDANRARSRGISPAVPNLVCASVSRSLVAGPGTRHL